MSVTILEALQNANYNSKMLKTVGMAILPIMQSQLNNAVTLLERGYSLEDEVEPLLEKYGNIDNIPSK